MRMAEEQKYISKWRRGFTRDEVLAHLHQSGIGKARAQQGWTNLQMYREPLLVVGDKCGWDAVNEYRKRGADREIINQFGEFMEMPVKTLVTLRHPLDNITAWVDSSKYKRIYGNEGLRYRRMIRRYKQFYTAAAEILEGSDYMLVHNEELIADPSHMLQRISDYLELPLNREWRRSSAKRVWSKPHQRRHDISWPEEYATRVEDFIQECPLLEYYRGL